MAVGHAEPTALPSLQPLRSPPPHLMLQPKLTHLLLLLFLLFAGPSLPLPLPLLIRAKRPPLLITPPSGLAG